MKGVTYQVQIKPQQQSFPRTKRAHHRRVGKKFKSATNTANTLKKIKQGKAQGSTRVSAANITSGRSKAVGLLKRAGSVPTGNAHFEPDASVNEAPLPQNAAQAEATPDPAQAVWGGLESLSEATKDQLKAALKAVPNAAKFLRERYNEAKDELKAGFEKEPFCDRKVADEFFKLLDERSHHPTAARNISDLLLIRSNLIKSGLDDSQMKDLNAVTGDIMKLIAKKGMGATSPAACASGKKGNSFNRINEFYSLADRLAGIKKWDENSSCPLTDKVYSVIWEKIKQHVPPSPELPKLLNNIDEFIFRPSISKHKEILELLMEQGEGDPFKARASGLYHQGNRLDLLADVLSKKLSECESTTPETRADNGKPPAGAPAASPAGTPGAQPPGIYIYMNNVNIGNTTHVTHGPEQGGKGASGNPPSVNITVKGAKVVNNNNSLPGTTNPTKVEAQPERFADAPTVSKPDINAETQQSPDSYDLEPNPNFFSDRANLFQTPASDSTAEPTPVREHDEWPIKVDGDKELDDYIEAPSVEELERERQAVQKNLEELKKFKSDFIRSDLKSDDDSEPDSGYSSKVSSRKSSVAELSPSQPASRRNSASSIRSSDEGADADNTAPRKRVNSADGGKGILRPQSPPNGNNKANGQEKLDSLADPTPPPAERPGSPENNNRAASESVNQPELDRWGKRSFIVQQRDSASFIGSKGSSQGLADVIPPGSGRRPSVAELTPSQPASRRSSASSIGSSDKDANAGNTAPGKRINSADGGKRILRPQSPPNGNNKANGQETLDSLADPTPPPAERPGSPENNNRAASQSVGQRGLDRWGKRTYLQQYDEKSYVGSKGSSQGVADVIPPGSGRRPSVAELTPSQPASRRNSASSIGSSDEGADADNTAPRKRVNSADGGKRILRPQSPPNGNNKANGEKKLAPLADPTPPPAEQSGSPENNDRATSQSVDQRGLDRWGRRTYLQQYDEKNYVGSPGSSQAMPNWARRGGNRS